MEKPHLSDCRCVIIHPFVQRMIANTHGHTADAASERLIINGDLNHAKISRTLTIFKQYVICNTRGNKTLDLLYVKEAFSATALPPLTTVWYCCLQRTSLLLGGSLSPPGRSGEAEEALMECYRTTDWEMSQQDHLDPLQQFAYKADVSVDDAIIYLLHRAYTHLEKPHSTVRIMFFDFSSAFDTVQPLRLAQKLSVMQVDEDLVAWITDDLTDRPQYVRLHGCLSDVV